jgi:tetratricopeptide (TPR) repeat protein
MSVAFRNEILTLARSGATQRAWEAFVSAGLDKAKTVDALTLKGRLLKDRARQAAGAERAALYAQSGAAYAQAAKLRPDSYPLINAAAMALLAGDGVKAQLYANKVLDLIESGADVGETPYWGQATRAEALLLLDRRDDAEDALGEAIIRAPEAWEDHAATLRQFAAILAAKGRDAAWLDPYRPPATLHFSGAIAFGGDADEAVARIGEAVADIAPGFAFGALAAGADILVAEALLARGAELHVVLPCSIAAFHASSVDPFGTDWAGRFDRLVVEAASLAFVTTESELSAAAVALADEVAMGMAIAHARLIEGQTAALRIAASERGDVRDPWQQSGHKLSLLTLPATEPGVTHALTGGQPAIASWSDAGEEIATMPLAEALAAARGMQSDDAHGYALDYRLPHHDGRERTQRMANAAGAGAILATKNAAMAAQLFAPDLRVEPMGEMNDEDGPFEVYALRF